MSEVAGALEYAPDAFAACGPDRRLTWVNKAAERICGASRADLTGLLLHEAFPSFPETLESCFEVECRGLWYRVRTVPAEDGGLHIWFQNTGGGERRYRSILATMTEAIALHDAAGVITDCNPSAERILGLTHPQLLGRTSLNPKWRTIREDGSPYEGLDHPVQRTLRTGEAFYGEVMGVHKPDGTLSWISIDTQPLGDGVLTTFSDITPQKTVEAELRAARGRLAALIESTGDPVWCVDLDFRMVAFNSALAKDVDRRYGLTIGVGQTPEQTFPDEASVARQSYQRCLDEGPLVLEYKTPSGDWFELNVHRMIVDGRTTGVSVFAKNITERRRAILALEESERRYRLISENMADVVWTMEWEKQRITYVSPSILSQRGFTAEEVMEQSLEQMLLPESLARVQAIAGERLKRLAAGDSGAPDSIRLEVDMWRKDGSSVPTEIVISVLREPDGRIGILGVTRNIGERRRAEETLRQRDTDLQEAQRLAKVGSWTFDVREDRLEWSEEVYRILGRDPSLPPLRIHQLASVYGHHGTLELQSSLALLLSGQSLQRTADLEIAAMDGERRWITVVAEAIRNEAGELRRIRGTIQDVTERIAAQRQLKSLAAAIEFTAELVLLLDEQGRIVYCNPAFEVTTGYRKEEAIGQTPRLLASGRHGPEMFEQMWRTAQAGAVWSGLITNRRKDGTLFDQESTISSIRDPAGRITGYVSVGRDITDRVNLENQVRQTQKLESIGLLAGGIAHDFNNLLTIVNGYGSLTLSRTDLPEGVHPALEQICIAGERAAVLTKQLLAFSRKQLLLPRPLDLQLFIEESAGMLSRIVGNDVEVIALPGRCRPGVADSGQLLQVLMNLAANARDAMPQGGTLRVEALDGLNETVRLRVSDTGVGIDKSIQERIFDPFFTTKAHGAGTGLGLSMAYGIVQQLGGSIAVQSEPGFGATFEITLQAVPESTLQSEPRAAQKAPRRSGGVHGQETILVVEDGPEVRQLTVSILRDYGYRVLEARSGDEALQVAGSSDFAIDLLLTDVVMPKMTGPETAERIRQIRPETRVLFMSGYPRDLVSRKGLLYEDVEYLAKPFTPEVLVRKIREVLSDG